LKKAIAINLKKNVILMANTKKIVGIILLVIGAVLIIFMFLFLFPYVIGTMWLFFNMAIVIGVVLCCIGLGLFLRSRKINK